MNCRRFQNQLDEYVEGSLSAGAQAAAERHLAGCGDCRRAVQEERQFAQSVSFRLKQDASGLTLGPEIRNQIVVAAKLTAAQGKSNPPTVRESIAELWNLFHRLAAIPACLLLLAAWLLVMHSSGTRIYHTETIASIDRSLHPAVSIQISYHLPECTFHREGNHVIDSLSDETIVASGIIQPESQGPAPQKTERKTSL
jgi:hypothetical protein